MPPGRPPKAVAALKKDKAKQKAMREALAFFDEMDVHLSDAQKERLLSNAKAHAEGDLKSWDDVAFPAHALVPYKDLQPLSPEELAQVGDRTKGLLGAIIAGFTAKVPELLTRLSSESPEKALKVYIELQEFVVPKLSRTETTGNVTHQATFVAVEARDADPRSTPALPGAESITVEAEVVPKADTATTEDRELDPGDTRETGSGQAGHAPTDLNAKD
jgi:hypothetical protein